MTALSSPWLSAKKKVPPRCDPNKPKERRRTSMTGLTTQLSIQNTVIITLAICYAALIHHSQASPVVVVLRTSNTDEYDFLGHCTNLNITVLALSKESLGFQDIREKLWDQFRKMETLAVVGSGDLFLDELAGYVADHLSLPFIYLVGSTHKTVRPFIFTSIHLIF